MRSAAIKTGLEAIFDEHTRAVYWSMAGRIKKKLKVTLPFTYAEYRRWVLDQFGGNWDSVAQCTYCTALLNVQTFVTDHREPLKFGGSIGLDNLALCCESCNLAKGSMSEDGFRMLIEFSVEYLHPQDANDIFSRLKNGSAYVRLRASLNQRPQKGFGIVTNTLPNLQRVS
jgi:HNH endonuclease